MCIESIIGQTSNTASREYVDHVLTQAKLYAEAIKSYIVTHFVGVLLAFLALILAFVWYLHNDTKQVLREAKQERREAKQERREAKQERQAIHNKLNILIQAQPPATPQAKPTSS